MTRLRLAIAEADVTLFVGRGDTVLTHPTEARGDPSPDYSPVARP